MLAFASRHALGLLMAALMIAAAFYTVMDLCFQPAYSIGDWLINYSDGFVRRGLLGEVILLAARAVHVPPPWMAVVFQLVIYALFLWGVYRLAAPLRRTMLWYAMMFSPAALALMILAPYNGVRKDTLAPVALVATIFLLRRHLPAAALSVTLAVMVGALVLSHDSVFCCFPYLFAAIAVESRNLRFAARVCALPLVVTGVTMNLVRTHLGNERIARAVCSSVGGRWINEDDTRNLCAGAIRHLSWTVTKSRNEELANLHYWPLYAVLLVLSLLPFVLALVVLYRRDRLHFEVKVTAWIAVLCALLSAPLFYFTIDWGRWIQMQVLCLLVMILLMAQRAPSFSAATATLPTGEGKRWRGLLWTLVFLYCTCWTLPVLGIQEVRFGYLNLPLYFHRDFRLLRNLHAWQTVDRGW